MRKFSQLFFSLKQVITCDRQSNYQQYLKPGVLSSNNQSTCTYVFQGFNVVATSPYDYSLPPAPSFFAIAASWLQELATPQFPALARKLSYIPIFSAKKDVLCYVKETMSYFLHSTFSSSFSFSSIPAKKRSYKLCLAFFLNIFFLNT